MTQDAERLAGRRRGTYVSIASILFFLTGLSFPVFLSYTVLYVVENERLPVIFGIQAFGGGFIEGLGPQVFVACGLFFLGLSALEVVAGYLLWKSRKIGGKLAVVLFPGSLAFWVGFLLPLPMLIGPLRLLLIASEWKTLR